MDQGVLRKGLLDSLNSNGFSFQHAAITRLGQLWHDGASPFQPRYSEFPVDLSGAPVHIDILLRHKEFPSYLVVECKRADPAISNWCFVKVPPHYVDWLNRTGERLVREVVVPTNVNPLITVSHLPPARVVLEWIQRTPEVYRLAFELKNGGKGDGTGKQLNTAVSQVLRGMNGLIAVAVRQPETFEHPFHRIAFLPVVLTTARLLVSNTDLTKAQLEDGNLTPDQLADPKECGWLFYQHPQSPGLKHPYSVTAKADHLTASGLSGLLYSQYTRTIAIVSPAGIEDFLAFVGEDTDWKF